MVPFAPPRMLSVQEKALTSKGSSKDRFPAEYRTEPSVSESILPVQAGVCQISLFSFPFRESPVIIPFLGVLDDKGNQSKAQTLL